MKTFAPDGVPQSMNSFRWILCLAASLPVLTVCGGEPPAAHTAALTKMILTVRKTFPDVKTISTTNLAAWLSDASRPQPQLLDVRTPKEYAVSHLHGARLVSPDAKAAEVMATVDGQRPLVVYCSVGYRSSQLAERLRSAGPVQVMNLEGSIFAWANEDRALEREGLSVAKVHPYDKRFGQMLKPERRAP